jgi:hypothetical protein
MSRMGRAHKVESRRHSATPPTTRHISSTTVGYTLRLASTDVGPFFRTIDYGTVARNPDPVSTCRVRAAPGLLDAHGRYQRGAWPVTILRTQSPEGARGTLPRGPNCARVGGAPHPTQNLACSRFWYSQRENFMGAAPTQPRRLGVLRVRLIETLTGSAPRRQHASTSAFARCIVN